ncbi:MAG: conjugative transfer ATPase [Gammaproteobacteria bacterium]|nr:conjugative transfer ATPase [Gammaproteobacteria bacterium]
MKRPLPKRFRDTVGPERVRPPWRAFLHNLGVEMGLKRNDEPHLSIAELKRSYERPPSFGQFLPIRTWEPSTRLFVMEDWASAAAILELTPVDAEARSAGQLESMLDAMVQAFAVIPERDVDPWIVQLYLGDEPLLDAADRMRQYAAEIGAEPDRMSEDFFRVMHEHLVDIGKPGGIFEDTHTGVRWGGRMRRARLVLTRRFDLSKYPERTGRGPHSELAELVRNLTHGLSAAGIGVRRICPGDYANWLYPWLNPKPLGHDSGWDWVARYPAGKDKAPRLLYDLIHYVLQHRPFSDSEQGVWLFNRQPHRYLPMTGFREEPRAGLLTLEKSAGRGRSAAFFDRLPPDTIFALTLVFQTEEKTRRHLEFMHRRSVSDSAESQLVRAEVEECQAAIARGNRMIRMAMGFYTRGRSIEDLHDRMARILALCQEQGLDAVDPEYDLFPLDEYVRYLPAGYHPDYDRYFLRERYDWLMNALAASPLWGKANGTGKPGFTFFDRAGQPLMLDILHPEDRDKAPHAVIIGPTGTGKSALLNYLALQVMALHRPHLYIIDAGDSFRLLGDYFRSRGLGVNYLRLDRSDVALPPFSNSDRMLDEQVEKNGGDEIDAIDFLGEMETIARMIITGCDEREERLYSREDRRFVRTAIIDAAYLARSHGRPHATLDDFIRILGEYAADDSPRIPHGYEMPLERAMRARIGTMRNNSMLFLDGVRGKLFNRPGQAWPESDVTIVDLGQFAVRQDDRDILSIVFIGLMNTIQRDAERRRGSGRQSVVMIDEAHLTTTNPLLAEYLTRGAKMWRKWGLWLWLATQSLGDFPDVAKRILGMAEFWFCLSMPKEEIEQVRRFRDLSEEDAMLLAESRKSPGRYSEGILLSGRPPMLFRNVPPAIAMALAQTEETEVAERMRVMEEQGLEDELEAVEFIAERIREARRQ